MDVRKEEERNGKPGRQMALRALKLAKSQRELKLLSPVQSKLAQPFCQRENSGKSERESAITNLLIKHVRKAICQFIFSLLNLLPSSQFHEMLERLFVCRYYVF